MASPEQAAHLLRRTGFGIRPGHVRELGRIDIHELIDERIADEGWALSPDAAESRDFNEVEWDTLAREWIDQMLSPNAGLHERMTWFWHGHFTSSKDKASDRLIVRQHHLMRRHALGNFRDFAREILVDGAMLRFLDGDGSHGDAPNENLSREFLEIFMLGKDSGYTEADIRAGARILSGWRVDYETSEVSFNPEAHYDRPVDFFGTRQRWSLDDYVDAVLEHEQCAAHVASRIHEHLVSTPLSPERRNELGKTLRENDWELRPLLANILHHDDFVEARGRRTRQPVEWFVAAATATGVSQIGENGFEFWQIYSTGQIPFRPPNVAGWPDDDRWSSATQIMARGNALLNWQLPDDVINSLEPTPEAVLTHLGIPDVSDATVAALAQAITAQTEYSSGLELLLVTAMLSPEFSLI